MKLTLDALQMLDAIDLRGSFAAAGRLVVKRMAEATVPTQRYLAWRSDRKGRALAWFASRLDTPAWRERLAAWPQGDSTKRPTSRRATGARK
ncbi:hypothetical protein RHDC4_03357 [Rhodocyclaceae bacterium]|nr:hypothetical protein RHDC4_03357 [Rhodocyclaceae bacterium]